ncbi:MAG: hypothetical protein FWD95_01775 [Nocardioidaceae bacterium]|nr:hypothetical protein [Nocardioidaceae bacterium]
MALSYGYQLWRRRPVTRPEVYVAGLPLSSVAPLGAWGSLHTKTIQTGDDEATWSFLNPTGKLLPRHPALVYGAPVAVRLGPVPIWVGALSEPNWDSGDFTAVGAPHEAEGALCLTSSGQTTSAPNVAVDAAIARGAVGWTRRDDFGSTALAQADDGSTTLTYLDQLLDAWATENNSGWAINQHRQLIITGPPAAKTMPDWFITPGTGDLGQAADNRVDRVFVRYVSTASGNPLATASYPATTPEGGKERGVNITSRGAITAARATAIAQGLWGKLAGESGWTNGLTLDRTQVATPGGLPATLGLMRGMDTMRLLGVSDPRGLGHHLDVVIGDTDMDWDADSLQANPTGLVSRSLEDVLTQDFPNSGYIAL